MLFLFLQSCDSQNSTEQDPSSAQDPGIEQEPERRSRKQHSYGGWYCPDNIRGFPAADIRNMDVIPVVHGRLPTKEESRDGRSLIYVDTLEYPNAKPHNIELPWPAVFYNPATGMDEYVIVIQALVIQEDTIVGFRFANGGNGSSWIDEVRFMNESEVKEIESTSYVNIQRNIRATREDVWQALTDSSYSKILGGTIAQGAYFESDWTQGADIFFKSESGDILNEGVAAFIWEGTYAQIQFNDANHLSKKVLLMHDAGSQFTELRAVIGPFGKDFMEQRVAWESWSDMLKELSETNRMLRP